MQDLSGDSVFFKDNTGRIYLTYATFGRGGEEFLGTYRFSRCHAQGSKRENGPITAWATGCDHATPMVKAGLFEPNGRYHQPQCSCSVHK